MLRPLQDGLVRLPSLWAFQFPAEILRQKILFDALGTHGFQKRVAMEHHGPRILTRKLVEPVLEFHPGNFSQRLSPNCGAGRTRESFARRGYFFATSLLSEYQAPFQVVTGLPSNEGTARLGVSGAGRSPDGMVIGHGDSPVRHAARRVFLGYTSESIAGFLVPKMKHRHRAGELLAESMERRKPGR